MTDPTEGALTPRPILPDMGFNGLEALRAAVRGSEYGSLEQAVAALTVFSSPDVVRETEGRNLFPAVRGSPRGEPQECDDGTRVLRDDNTTPSNVFVWANGLGKIRDVQFNHLTRQAKNVRHYTSIANMCVTPAFLGRVTDSRTCADIQALLKYRAFCLYGDLAPMTPEREPPLYAKLWWAPPLDYAGELETRMRRRMKRQKKCAAAVAARMIGWYFSGFQPDSKV